MERKKRAKSKKNGKIILFLFGIVILAIFGYRFLKPNKKNKVAQTIKVEEQIESYGYELAENETDYYKGLFKNLKSVLNEEAIEEEKYAALVCQLFLADFFNLDNKLSKNDVGGLQFVYSEYQSDFEKYAKEEVYRYVENNLYGDRKQKLPIVSEVSVLNVEKKHFIYLETEDKEAYQVDLKIHYKEDMGYQATATLYLVHHNDKLEIIKMTE